MTFSQSGADDGRLVVYFHGAPGSPQECTVFGQQGKIHGLRFICFDRFAVDPALDAAAYYQSLAEAILQQAAEKSVDVVGFSIGAFVALQVCRHLPKDSVRNLHLVSAAAPLEAGNFLDAMAGKRVFQLAKTFPVGFVLLSYWQKLLAVFFPKALFHLLFATAAGEDKTLVADPAFQSSMTKVLQACFAGRVRGYTRDIKAYVQPWASTLAEITCDTYLWHGAEDNWSPKGMAEYLATAIPGCVRSEIIGNCSHYSCLYTAAPEIGKSLTVTTCIPP